MLFRSVNVPSILYGGDSEDIEAFMTDDGLCILKSVDNTKWHGKLKHISVSRHDRYPSWEEILEVKEQLFGDIDVAMIMPKKKDYVNAHPNCFHLWEMPESWGIG